MGAFNRDLSGLLETNRGELDRIVGNLDDTLKTVERQLGPVQVALDRLDENGRAAFLSSRHGDFLNQPILYVTVLAPPAPTPIVPGPDPAVGHAPHRAPFPSPPPRPPRRPP